MGNPYAPPTSYAGLWQWLQYSGVVSSSGNVTAWNDSSGNGHNASTVSGPPLVGSYTLNGYPAVYFPAHSFVEASGPQYVYWANCTVFAVVQPVGTLTDFAGVYDNDYVNSFYLGTNATASAWKFIMNDSTSPYGACEGGTPAIGTPVLLTAQFANTGTSGTGLLQVDGITVAAGVTFTTPTLTSSTSVAYCGRVSGGSSYNLQCYATGGAVFNTALSSAQLVLLNAYFGYANGITVPTPPVYLPPQRTVKPRGHARTAFVIPALSTVLNAGLKKAAAAVTPTVATNRRLHFTADQVATPKGAADALFRLQTAIEYLQKFVTASPLSSSALLQQVPVTAGNAVRLYHRLGRVPYGWFVVDAQTSAWAGYRVPPAQGANGPSGGPQEQDYLTLMPANTGTYSFLVF